MKKSLLLVLSIALCFGAMAQVAQYMPNGFRRANIPASMKNKNIKVLSRTTGIDNPVPDGSQALQNVPLRAANFPTTDEFLIGSTYYDLQTNNSISNRLVVSDDGTISAAWTFSPDGEQGSPIYPRRGTGYNYWDGSSWLYPAGPLLRQESVRTGFTNIVVTPISELTIAHSIAPLARNRIAVNWRATKGSGAWSITYPWGNSNDTWPKATSAGTSGSNNNVYVIFQGSGVSGTKVMGQDGPLFFASSNDGGATWSPKRVITEIDSTHYYGFGGDDYSIDAKGDTVAISIGKYTTDLILLKSIDAGANWVKTIIQKHPIPFYDTCKCGTYYIPNAQDPTVDTVYSNAGDSKVLIDNVGKCHVFFSRYDYYDADSDHTSFKIPYTSDDLFYWNEDMAADTGGARSYVSIASAQDFNGDSKIDLPKDTFTACTNQNPWGTYGRNGFTQMPSAGIDASGRIYLSYQTIAEYPVADTTFYHALHRHVYMKTLAPIGGVYDPANWTYPYDLIPTIADGGDGFSQEGVFACTARRVDNNYAYVLYQRDNAPGHSLAAAGSCDKYNNYPPGSTGNSSDIVLCRVNVNNADVIGTVNSNNLFVSQNYPNPSTSSTYVNIGLKKSSNVKVEVYDLIGKVVYSESKGILPAGPHTIHFNTSNWETGVYTYSVIADGERTTRRMIVQ